MEEVYYTITIEKIDGSLVPLSFPETDPVKIKYLKRLYTKYHRDLLGDNEAIHKMEDDGPQ